MSTVDKLLDRLEGVRRTGPGKWLARCPAHDDRHASMSIKETEDGRTLLHCFGGCAVEDVLVSVGLDMSDLYPERVLQPGQAGAKIPKFNASELLRGVLFEAAILTVAIGRLTTGAILSDDDLARVDQAVNTIDDMRRAVMS